MNNLNRPSKAIIKFMPQLFKFHDAQILCVKVKSHSNAKDTRAELIKKFSKTSKSIRQGKNRNQF